MNRKKVSPCSSSDTNLRSDIQSSTQPRRSLRACLGCWKILSLNATWYEGKKFSPLLSVLICAIISMYGCIIAVPTTYAAGVPGGNITDSVVRAVNIAKPAVVRILTTLDGQLTVTFPNSNTVTFPRDGGDYKFNLWGSGAFISSHGHILTADHVIRPSHDSSLDSALYNKAAQDVADYINRNFQPTTPWTANDAFAALITESFHSSSRYTDPTSRIYLSTDYTGPVGVSTLAAMPKGTYVDVDQILAEEKGLLNGDTAIIHVDLKDTPSVKLGDSTNVAQQDELTIIGFPGNGDLDIDSNGKSIPPNPSTGFFTSSVNKLYVSAIKQTKSGASLIQVGGNVEHGDSGGPALDRNGNIVGIVSFGVSGTGTISGTSFLQASETAQKLIKGLQINTDPGAFQKTWRQAFEAYASTEPGHWHEAQRLFQQLQKKYAKDSDQTSYPNFGAVKPFLSYATQQADKEPLPSEDISLPPQTIVLVIVIILSLAVLTFLLLRRKPRVAISSLPLGCQPAQSGNQLPPNFQQTPQSGQISPSESVLSNVCTGVDGTPAQGSASSSLPPVPWIPSPTLSATPAVTSASTSISPYMPVANQQSHPQPPASSSPSSYPQNQQQVWPLVSPQSLNPGCQPHPSHVPYSQLSAPAWPPVAGGASISYSSLSQTPWGGQKQSVQSSPVPPYNPASHTGVIPPVRPAPPAQVFPLVQSSRVSPHSEQFGNVGQELPPPELQVAPTLVSSLSPTPSLDDATE